MFDISYMENTMQSFFPALILYFLFQASIGFAQDLYTNTELEKLKTSLTIHPKLSALDAHVLEDFALILLNSGFSYGAIGNSLNRFLKNGDLPFKALEKAISSEENKIWRNSQIRRLSEKPDLVTSEIQKLDLKASEKQTALSIYALCIEPLKYSAIRAERFMPRICDPIDNYNHMRHHDSVSIRRRPSKKNNDRVKAYNILVQAGKETIASQKLENLEILLMAKCIAEKSITFMAPKKHPLDACHESIKARSRSPESALFQETGACPNTSGIAYNMARALGFSGPLFFARHHMHVFLETQVQGEWLHFHPLKSHKNSCDFVRFE